MFKKQKKTDCKLGANASLAAVCCGGETTTMMMMSKEDGELKCLDIQRILKRLN